MSENEKNPTSETAANADNSANSPDLLTVAARQRTMLIALLIYCLVIIGTMFIAVVQANESVLLVLAGLTVVFFGARLCWVLYGRASAILLTVLILIPYVNILLILMISSKTTKMLKEKGFKVGLLGANLKEVAAGQ